MQTDHEDFFSRRAVERLASLSSEFGQTKGKYEPMLTVNIPEEDRTISKTWRRTILSTTFCTMQPYHVRNSIPSLSTGSWNTCMRSAETKRISAHMRKKLPDCV